MFPGFILDESHLSNNSHHLWQERLNELDSTNRPSVGAWNSYINQNYNESYYFCMEPRNHSILNRWNKKDIFGPDSKQKIIATTAK
jgi:hypothetical protein